MLRKQLQLNSAKNFIVFQLQYIIFFVKFWYTFIGYIIVTQFLKNVMKGKSTHSLTEAVLNQFF